MQDIAGKIFIDDERFGAGFCLIVSFTFVSLFILLGFCAFLLLLVSGRVQTHDIGLHSLEVVLLQKLLLRFAVVNSVSLQGLLAGVGLDSFELLAEVDYFPDYSVGVALVDVSAEGLWLAEFIHLFY
jgi:hypothetical protein